MSSLSRLLRLVIPDHAGRARVNKLLDRAFIVCGLIVLALLTVILGWPVSEFWREEIARVTQLILALFACQELFRYLINSPRRTLFRRRRAEAVLALLVVLEISYGTRFIAWLQSLGTGLAPATLTLLYLGATQLTLLAALAVRTLRENRWLADRSLSPSLVFTLSLVGLIGLGTLLLKTPHATYHGISWFDAIFISTSAVSVTGLASVDVPSTFTLHGQWVLLGLFQLGGLGVMTITYFIAYFLAGGVSLRNRVGLQDLLSEENLGQIGGVLATIVTFTLVTELVGAVLIYHSLHGLPDPPQNLAFFALFHSVSAFCNAGFSTADGGLAHPGLAPHTGFLWVMTLLVIIGGLGFPVVKNFRDYGLATVRRRLGLRVATPPRLTAHSRIVLLTTFILLIPGAGVIWLTEFAFGAHSAITGGSSWFTALFQSAVARTAGFNITPTESLLPATAATMMFLMFVGGGPASTAGGIKVSTLAVAFLSLRRELLGRRDIEAFGRRLPDELAHRALSVILVAVAFTTAVSIAICALHPDLPAADMVFEAVSAVGTVGLSRGVTDDLGPAAKMVLCFAMVVGRVGVLAFLAAFIRKRENPGVRLPETTIVVG